MQRQLRRENWVPTGIDEVFDFFSKAENLELLTPDFLKFTILSKTPIAMHVGQQIDYRIKLMGIPMRWRSVISTWDPPKRFVDEQLRGPYKKWHHLHTFESVDGGTLLIDEVDYQVAGGPLEPLIHKLLVGPQLKAIFDYRTQKIEELFGKGERPTAAGAGRS